MARGGRCRPDACMAEVINEQSVSTFDNLSCKTEKELGNKMYEETEAILLVWGYE